MPVFNFIKKRIDSVGYALNGVFLIIKTQHNAWIHTMMTFIVIILGFVFRINFDEWMFIILSIMSVWVAEGLNTALECLSDSVTSEYHPLIGKAKDVAAGAVLIAASGATVIGCIVFLPKIFAHF
ncbi:MAG: diacylglycerol kinase family protein [Chitinivibrionia bacterium]|jgi:diacylglycerol kinase (ATP)|nr:diacylglycerol kinase family protein [Chitinivibrionia bacterium]